MSPDDEIPTDTLCRAVAGDALARDGVVRSIAPRVRVMVAARLGSNHAMAEDVTQETLLAVAGGIGTRRAATPAALRAYVSGVVQHKVADALRRHAHDPLGAQRAPTRGAEESSALRLVETLTGSGTTPSSSAARAEHVRIVIEELQHLGDDQRRALTLAFFDQLNTTQIGAVLGIKRTAAAMVVARALAELRARWRRRDSELG